ncbi:methyl-accepting chemotaxis protein [Actimicrobium sp. CCI2.3]|uniref:methyl-accepting chemotaxis protein n=1 Tax=Actimicrobium sp. CCI2.3 TaxID=3048616 RepID=UPI002AB4D854|nr:methyl-accepting chemotaxis protein [Actimicrobium sp. CCI2.3]MDY7573158.1 methyl-accepting chemotaxis protein [Actimicrobium sp. CCI2.3]MEB0022137.1 methyl-accepting chemotaxis protein [Actimicrobium sp. CCI2.3]
MSDISTFLNKNYVQADRLMLCVLWGLFVMSLGLSGMHDTLIWALLIGLPAVLIPTALILAAGGSLMTRLVVAAALMIFSALHIHQAAGMTELHFGIFVLLAVLLCYRDWAVILVAAVVIAVHHLSFNYLQQWGYGVLCFTDPGLGKVITHAAYVVVESGVLAYLAVMLHKDAVQSAELNVSVEALTGKASGVINLSAEKIAAKSDSGLALQGAVAILHNAVTSVRSGIDTMAVASREIATGIIDLSARTEHQASALSQTATSMLNMTTTVKQNVERAREANQMALDSSAIAVKGGEVVSRVVLTMQSISASSRKISDITSVVDSIAFQTNILALNAAVEAARAGEQGRGFAVVAAEVRNLAQRSAAAAKDISSLINESVTSIDAGSTLASEAGTTMTDIVTSIQKVNTIMIDISTASQEQSLSIEQVNQAIGQMDQVTQQNAALVEESAAASEILQQQAASLVEVVSIFRLDEQAQPLLRPQLAQTRSAAAVRGLLR